MAWVFDASVTMAWCFQDERTAKTDALLERLATDPGSVPQLWHLEVANILAQAMRQKKPRIGEKDATAFLAMLMGAPIRIDPQTIGNAWVATIQLAIKHKLSAYDAAYLELALRLQCDLATLDRELQTAALAEGLAVIP